MRRSRIAPLVLGIAIGILVLLFKLGGIFFGFDLLLGDTLLTSRGNSNDVVIIAIDDESIGRIGQWPWPRAEYARLIRKLSNNPPKVLGIDVLFAEGSRVGAGDDATLASALGSTKFKVVLASRTSDGVVPLPQFFGNNLVTDGEVSLSVDQDGIVRRFHSLDSFASLVAGEEGKDTLARIVWAGPPGTFRRIPYYRLWQDDTLAETLAGKIVLIGSTATDLHDEQLTAIARGEAMPGVEIQANLVNAISNDYEYKEASIKLGYAFILGSALLPVLIFILISNLWLAIGLSLIGLLVLFLSLVAIFSGGWALPVLYPVLGWLLSMLGQILYRYFGVEQSKREIKNLFGKYVSADVLAELLKNPDQVKLGGEEREVTVLFSDVRGFTSFSEAMSPQELTHFLNRYLSRMTNIILTGRGVVDKYIGDAIMAFWGAPIVSKTHRIDAILVATNMLDDLTKLNIENKELGLKEIEIGIGLNSGRAVAGNMGSEHRFDYTLMGDTVNLSSRLESLTKYYGVGIIASEGTIKAVASEELIRLGITMREIDRVQVKGKTQAVRLFEVVSPLHRDSLNKIKDNFDLAREYYYEGQWDKCLNLLGKIDKIVPLDGPTRVLRERCQEFQHTPPSNWTGVYEHKSK